MHWDLIRASFRCCRGYIATINRPKYAEGALGINTKYDEGGIRIRYIRLGEGTLKVMTVWQHLEC
jgi:hypothetical protein